jgi:hypothetical protein
MKMLGWNTRMRLALLLLFVLSGACAGDESNVVDQDDDSGKADTFESSLEFFEPGTFYYVCVDGWPNDRLDPESLEEALSFPDAEVRIFRSDPDSPQHCPDREVTEEDLVHRTGDFSLRMRGNFTFGQPKSSYAIRFTERESRLAEMRGLNLMSMWNDVSQMREALAWRLFERASVSAPRHTYARLCINGRYYGLYSIVERVDKEFLDERFDRNDQGNLYKANWGDIGPATLAYRADSSGDDSGRQYFRAADIGERTYELDTNEDDDDDPEHQTYDDLAAFLRVINGEGLSVEGPERFDTEEYREAVEAIFDARTFLRWAATSLLLGAWDNYWGTPSNYFLYNSGYLHGRRQFMTSPYFHWVAWDYDNSLCIDYFDVDWWHADIVDWEAATAGYHDDGSTTELPLIRNLLQNETFLQYYLDFMEHMLDRYFNEEWVSQQIGSEGSGGFWDLVRTSAYLEADSQREAPHTGRRFTNDQVYWNGLRHHELIEGDGRIIGIIHAVRMRHDRARAELAAWRELYPRGSSGVFFPDVPAPLPDLDEQ